jgi:hypothetical protein
MNGTSILERQWVRALDAATDAVEASARAHTLPARETADRRRLLAAERAWLGTVNWSSLGPSRRAVVVLAPPSRAAGREAIRRAA